MLDLTANARVLYRYPVSSQLTPVLSSTLSHHRFPSLKSRRLVAILHIILSVALTTISLAATTNKKKTSCGTMSSLSSDLWSFTSLIDPSLLQILHSYLQVFHHASTAVNKRWCLFLISW